VQTLKSLIEDKDGELKRSKKYMEKVKEEYVRKQNQDAEEVKKLQDRIFQLNLQLSANFLTERFDLQNDSQTGVQNASSTNEGVIRDQNKNLDELKRRNTELGRKTCTFLSKTRRTSRSTS